MFIYSLCGLLFISKLLSQQKLFNVPALTKSSLSTKENLKFMLCNAIYRNVAIKIFKNTRIICASCCCLWHSEKEVRQISVFCYWMYIKNIFNVPEVASRQFLKGRRRKEHFQIFFSIVHTQEKKIASWYTECYNSLLIPW